MNMVVCRHGTDSGRYLFRMPENVTIDAGALVMVETKYGVQNAQCVTNSFHADPEVICPLWGTQPEKMKRVLSVLFEHDLEWPDETDIQEQAFVDEDEEP